MTTKYLMVVVLLMAFFAIAAQSDLKYLGQKPPGLIPEKFAPGLISMPLEYEFGSVFSRNGTEFFYSVNVNGREETRYTRLVNGSWTEPQVILSHKTFSYNDPMLSNDEQRLYVISTKSEDEEQPGDYDIWYLERLGQGWSDPINAGPMINTETSNEYYISFTSSGAMYFSSNKAAAPDLSNDFDIYKSEFIKGQFQEAERLPFNSEHYEADVFVDPEESYVIFAGRKPEGLGGIDLYISFNNQGIWSAPKNMGEEINDPSNQFCPFVTKDGKYFLYSSNKDIYWVDASIIEGLR